MTSARTKIVATLLTLGVFVAFGVLLSRSIAVPHDVGIHLLMPSPPAHQRAIVPPKGWTLLDMDGRFSLYAPPGTAYQPVRGIDSFVGHIDGQGFALDFDYGAYSDDLRGMRARPGYTEETTSLAGRQAVIRSAAAPQGGRDLGLYIAIVRCGHPGYGIDCAAWVSLEIHGTASDSAAAVTVKTLFRTIDFPSD